MQTDMFMNKRKDPRPGQLYKHFKGNLYQIVAVAEHTETAEAMVVYQALYGSFKVYVRPLDMFMSKVDKEKYPEAAQIFRFEQVSVEESAPEASLPKEVTNTEAKEAQTEPDVEIAEKVQKPQLDDGIWEFLDADSFEEKFRIFTGMQHRLTDEMINIMAVSMDTEVPEGALSDRIASLKNYLSMQVKFECSRVR